MRKLNLLILIVAVSAMAGSCTTKREQKENPPIQKSKPVPVNELPAVILYEQSGKQFLANSLGGKTVLIFFGATCDHCQREATDIQRNQKGFEHYTLYFVSLDPFPLINQFATDYHLDRQSNIHFVRADGTSVFKELGNIQTPTILIYSESRQLVRRFDGETKVEEILKLL
jgi:cytochrome oxidase Cu insertion factor (SCO1/SenC/PrrC family)